MTELPPHVYHRIAEDVSRMLEITVSTDDVEEILRTKTLGWPDGVVAAVQMEVRTYDY